MNIKEPHPQLKIVDKDIISRPFIQWLREFISRVKADDNTLREELQYRITPTSIKLADYKATGWDLVLCDPTSGAFQVTLPAIQDTTQIGVKNISASNNSITIVPTGGTIDGSGSAIIQSSYGSITLISDLTRNDWIIE